MSTLLFMKNLVKTKSQDNWGIFLQNILTFNLKIYHIT